jgi:isopenicillin N synthase-like dioxygenase
MMPAVPFTNLILTVPGLQSKKIFDSPVEEKKQCNIQQNNRGWSGMHSEVLDPSTQKVGDYKEYVRLLLQFGPRPNDDARAFNFGEFIDGKAQQPLPPSIANDEPLISAFADSCHNLCRRILLLLGVGLGVRYLLRHSTSFDPGADL